MKKFMIAIFMAALTMPTLSFADSGDTEGVIKDVNTDKGTITLEDGKVYTAPSEFNFDGLKPGVKVIIYFSGSDGKRVIDDLQTE
jgi:hypothetical protein